MQTIKWFYHRLEWLALLGLLAWMAPAPAAHAQARPYIGYAYPAGGQQGTTVQVRLGGQGLDDVNAVLVTGAGVKATVAEYCRRLNNQELQLLNEQLRILKKATSAVAAATSEEKVSTAPEQAEATQKLIARIEKRTREFVQTPACASISSLVLVEVKIDPDAVPGARELRLVTLRGVSNPLVFHVGQLPECSRKPMISATLQVLGKEESALRKRPADEAEDRIAVPCTVNGQIASGEVNRYRFEARQGQRLVVTTQARQLIPYIADAVPGWFQPVLTLSDGQGKELAFADDYRFNSDPVIFFDVPKDGEYVVAITDAIYRGREDFVYRISIGETPFVTSLFPLGAQVGGSVTPKIQGWNLQEAELTPAMEPTLPLTHRSGTLSWTEAEGRGEGASSTRVAQSESGSFLPNDAAPRIQTLVASRNGFVSNRLPFALDTLPDGFDNEPNNTQMDAQKVTLPLIINGRVDKPDDWDVFQFTGKSNETVVAEVQARRLDSPLDSVIKLADATGRLLAFSDDREDLGAGANTHHADSYFLIRLPADGTYFVHIGDTARKGGEEYGYRLRLSAPQPDFALRVVPSSIALRSKSTAAINVHVIRRDGFTGPIKLALKDPPAGFSASPAMLSGTQTVARLTVRSSLMATEEPVSLSIVGSAKIGEKELTREAVPAEDRMQAFLWRHLVPASDLKVLVFDPAYQPPPKRAAPARPPFMAVANGTVETNAPVALAASTAAKPRFTKQQVAGRLRQLKWLFEEGLLTDDFYSDKVAECEAVR